LEASIRVGEEGEVIMHKYKKIDKLMKELRKELKINYPPYHFQHSKVFGDYCDLKKSIDEGKVS